MGEEQSQAVSQRLRRWRLRPGLPCAPLLQGQAVLLRGPRLALHTWTSHFLPAQDALAHSPLLRKREPGEHQAG